MVVSLGVPIFRVFAVIIIVNNYDWLTILDFLIK